MKLFKDASMAKIQAHILAAHPEVDAEFVKCDGGFTLHETGKSYPLFQHAALSAMSLASWKNAVSDMINNYDAKPSTKAKAKPEAKAKVKPEAKAKVAVEMVRTAVSFPNTEEARAAVLAFCAKLRDEARG
jgi:uncharacterized protein YdgA (DUF945 family)